MTQPPFDAQAALAQDGPLSREQALAALDHAADLMAASRFVDAARLYQRVIGFDDQGVTSAALLGFGQAMHRLDDEAAAVGAWQEVVQLPTTPATYPAWRELAGARVRAGDLAAAAEAYRQADRLAPTVDRAEIASRLGWLSKELGDSRSAGRYFSRARGRSAMWMTVALVAVTTILSLVADIGGPDGGRLLKALELDKAQVAGGELYRLLTVALVHAPLFQDPFHLPFNMYALWLVGPYVERMYGPWRLLAFYVLFVLGASLTSFALATAPSDQEAVGASGGIFGLFGLLAAALAVHKPVLRSATRGLLGQLVALIAINLLLGATAVGIDNMAHIGGLATGLWIGFLIAPAGVPTLPSLWRRPGPEPGMTAPVLGRWGTGAVQAAGLAGVAVAFAVLWQLGAKAWAG